jgi:hypothetical protein
MKKENARNQSESGIDVAEPYHPGGIEGGPRQHVDWQELAGRGNKRDDIIGAENRDEAVSNSTATCGSRQIMRQPRASRCKAALVNARSLRRMSAIGFKIEQIIDDIDARCAQGERDESQYRLPQDGRLSDSVCQ